MAILLQDQQKCPQEQKLFRFYLKQDNVVSNKFWEHQPLMEEIIKPVLHVNATSLIFIDKECE